MRQVAATDGPSRCGWCSTGHHLPTATSRGCRRYQRVPHPCPCDHPKHEEPARK